MVRRALSFALLGVAPSGDLYTPVGRTMIIQESDATRYPSQLLRDSPDLDEGLPNPSSLQYVATSSVQMR